MTTETSPATAGELKTVILETLIRRIRDGESVMTKAGEVAVVDAPAATICAGINFLKQFPPDEGDEMHGELSDELKKYASKMPYAGRA